MPMKSQNSFFLMAKTPDYNRWPTLPVIRLQSFFVLEDTASEEKMRLMEVMSEWCWSSPGILFLHLQYFQDGQQKWHCSERQPAHRLKLLIDSHESSASIRISKIGRASCRERV